MDKPLVTIKYKTANVSGNCVEVSTPVKELLEQSTRQFRRSCDKMESYKRLNLATNQLSEAQRRRVHLRFVSDLTHRRIAEMEGVNRAKPFL